MLCVDERGDAAAPLGLGDDVQRQSGLARRLGPVHLDDAAARNPTDTERDVEGERPGRDVLDPLRLGLPQPHDRALAVGALDLSEGGLQRAIPFCRHRLTPLFQRSHAPSVHFDCRLDHTTF